LPQQPKSGYGVTMNLAVIMPRWVGDAVMATPALAALRSHYPSARIVGVMRPVIADLLAGTAWLDGTIYYDRHRRDPAMSFAAAARAMRANRPDITVVFPNSLSSAALAWRGGGRRRVGAAGHWRRWLLSVAVPPHRDAHGRVDIVPPPQAFMDVISAIGVPCGPLDVSLVATPAEVASADAVLAELFPDRNGPLIILNDNSASGTARAWGSDKLAALARWLGDRLPNPRLVVHCGPADRSEARDVVTRAAHPAVAGLHEIADLPIGLSKGLFVRAALAISSDSGPRHIAAAFGVPTVALIGPTDPRLGRSAPDRCTEIRRDIDCSPCGAKECPLGHHDCMRLITVEEVGRAAIALLDRGATQPNPTG
jgi:heptosyltransferase-2